TRGRYQGHIRPGVSKCELVHLRKRPDPPRAEPLLRKDPDSLRDRSRRLALVDVSGRVVATLVDGIQRSGRYELAWDGTRAGQRLTPGLYFVRLTAPDRTVVRKLATVP
ncbi:MAG: hypothetical protein E6K73_09485, partial [Candidatus Eisenbacteria bacterium]